MTTLQIILKIIAFILGIMFIYLSFLYEDEDKRIKNWFADAWLKLDDKDRTFTQKLNGVLTNYHKWFNEHLDKFFGVDVMSKQSVFLSYCLSIISVYTVLLFYHIGVNIHEIMKGQIDEKVQMRILVIVGQIFVTSILAKQAINNDKEFERAFWFIIFACAGSFFPLLASTFEHHTISKLLYVAFMVLFPLFIGLDIVFFMGIRFASKRISKNLSLMSKILIFLLSTLFSVVLIYPLLTSQIKNSSHGFSYLFYLSASNAYIFLISLTYSLIIIFHFMNSILWNIFKRPIYMLQQNDFLKYKHILSVIGLALMGYVWKDGADWIGKLF